MNLKETINFYKSQNVHFPYGDEDYINIQKADIESNKSHYHSLREKAKTEAAGHDFFGIVLNGEVWLFPVSQKHLKGLYSKIKVGGDIDVIALHQAVGWAPIGMPFIGMNDHWQALRTNVAGVFHTTFMDKYFDNFNVATKHYLETLGANGTIDVRKSLHEYTYESASLGLFGAKVEAAVPYAGKEGTVPF